MSKPLSRRTLLKGLGAAIGLPLLDAMLPAKRAGSDIKLGVSVDQVAAKAIGQNMRFPSIELGCEGGRRAGECDSGYSCAYVSNISWSSETTPMPKLVNPQQVFDRLFGDAGG